MVMGAPTKCTPEVIKKAREYLEGGYTTTANPLFPSVVGLAGWLKLGRSTINLWATQTDKKDFLDILEQIQVLQHDNLLYKGLTGDYNAAIAKLALGKHGYSDKIENTGKDGGAIQVETKTVSLEEKDIINDYLKSKGINSEVV